MVSEPSAIDPLIDEAPSRYVVGIDLGTTNCAVCYVDTSRKPWQARVLKIPQLVARGEIEARETLPSFHYEPPCDAMPDQGLELPWTSSGGDRGKAGRKKPNQRGAKRNAKKTQSDAPANRPRREIDYAVGFMARDEGMLAPGHLIASAKSWLCHTGIDRLAEVLPWHGAPDVQRLSPVEVSARLLMHIRDAWDDRHPSNKLADQDIVVTLPASFDEVARELTIEAAARAGLRRVVLIEEPQAAFYAWLDKHSDTWQQQVRAGQNILVCDIGGGTTDFTLIQARPAERQTTESQDIQFHRVAVGDHLILGGDNLDLALAQYVEQRLTGGSQLPKRQWGVLVRSCRHMKEILLADDAPASYQMNLPGGGSKVIGGSMQIEISKDEIHNLLLEGFLPRVKLDARPQQRQSGFQEFGLPYAPDPAITRYLAEFLTAHCRQEPEQEPRLADGETADGKKAAGREAARKAKVARTKSRTKSQKKSQTISSGAKSSQEVLSQTVSAATDPRSAATPAVARPDIILLNGGFFASPVLRQRLLDVVRSWFVPRNNSTWSPLILENDRLDMAVARGAAYYGMVRRGKGVRIRANLARSYYIRVDGPEPSAVCLAPGSAEAGQDIALENRTFELLVSQPVEFPLYVSSTRLTDPPGRIVPINLEQMTALPPIRTVLKTQRRARREAIPVQLHSRLTETGTFDLWCHEVDSDRRWRLQFDVRSTTQTDIQAHAGSGESAGVIDEATWEKCHERIRRVFSADTADSPAGLVKRLAKVLGLYRNQWPPSLLRRMWEALLHLEAGRRISEDHEARWLNLTGYSLRPGFGVAIDDWRVVETWRTVRNKLVHHGPSIRNESLILWRRISGGLTAGQQTAIAEPLLSAIRATYGSSSARRSLSTTFRPSESIEVWRVLGSLEWLNLTTKIELGDLLCELLTRPKLAVAHSAMAWALGRLGQRATMYGPLNTVVPGETAENWLQHVLQLQRPDAIYNLAVMQLARKTNDRYRDLSDSARRDATRWLQEQQAASHLIELVREGGRLDREEQGQIFGESLPTGLRLRQAG